MEFCFTSHSLLFTHYFPPNPPVICLFRVKILRVNFLHNLVTVRSPQVGGEGASATLLPINKKFAGESLLIDRAIGILGRNVLNNPRLVFDGLREKWDEQK